MRKLQQMVRVHRTATEVKASDDVALEDRKQLFTYPPPHILAVSPDLLRTSESPTPLKSGNLASFSATRRWVSD